jgi:hypothetical protein
MFVLKACTALSGNGLACCIRLGAECMLSPPDEGFVPYPQGAIIELCFVVVPAGARLSVQVRCLL